jgi:protein SCO1/2
MTEPEKQDYEGDIPTEQESSLLNFRTLLIAAGGLVAMIVFVQLMSGLIYGFFVAGEPRGGGPEILPPEPRLQVAPAQELEILRATERANLEGYGWIDRESGVIRIPIERAMEQIAAQGLPVRKDLDPGERRVEADESGFPNATLGPPQTPGPEATSLLELTASPPVTASLPVTGTGTPALVESPAPQATQPAGTPAAPAVQNRPGAAALTVAYRGNAGGKPPDPIQAVGFDQNLGAQVPLDLAFRDEAGQPVRLGDFLGSKPVILLFAYYECPMLCTLVLNDLTETLQAMNFDVGDQFAVVTVSMDPRETPALAIAKKAAYLRAYGRPGAAEGWHFLTGDEPEIKSLAETVGFRYAYDARLDQYAHPTGIMILTPQGQISRYFFGLDYPANDVRLGLIEASERKIGSPVDQFFLLCYAYDPATGRYSLAITKALRLAGAATALGLGGFVLGMLLRERRLRSNGKTPAWLADEEDRPIASGKSAGGRE